MAESLEGYVEKIVYRNQENGYTVLSLAADDDEITCVGTFVFINEGEYVSLEGNYISHPTYGEQFQVTQYDIKQPDNAKSMERYLASGAIKGIGEALAARIVKKFDDRTFHIIENEPERLAEIKGISIKKAQEIYEQFHGKKELRSATMFLAEYSIGVNLAVKIYQRYKNELYEIIRTNPYRLAEEMDGVGFQTADDIAVKAGIGSDSEYRVKAGILYCLMQAAANGHVYLPKQELIGIAVRLLMVDENEVRRQLDLCCFEKKVILQVLDGMECIYHAPYYYLELNTARMLHDLNLIYNPDPALVNARIDKLQKSFDIELDEMQRLAVEEAARCGLFILTGGPGTGKTTTINAIIRFFEEEGMDILLAAPTGRAAKRMKETTGYEARTIHRMLELGKGGDGSGRDMVFERDESNPLECDAVIIDEMSMVDISLMHALLRAIVVGTRVIFVGDVNQLPSVGPGNVLHDMIESEKFHVVCLTKIFRQASESDIVVNAHKINAGEQIKMDNKSKDFFMLQRLQVNDILGLTVSLVRDKLPGYVNAGSFDIQVLTPMRKGELGVENLNQVLQKYLNPPSEDKAEKEAHGMTFREGDKVMQVKNNYQLTWKVLGFNRITIQDGTGVFNGDIGIIREINLFAEIITVEFDEGRLAEYPFSQLDELEMAYAITIHKSQGSEYPAVVLPILTGPRQLLHRNLLYTAVTRAKNCVTLIGSKDTVWNMIENINEQKRYSGLHYHLKDQ